MRLRIALAAALFAALPAVASAAGYTNRGAWQRAVEPGTRIEAMPALGPADIYFTDGWRGTFQSGGSQGGGFDGWGRGDVSAPGGVWSVSIGCSPGQGFFQGCVGSYAAIVVLPAPGLGFFGALS
jgi:hypothetical protein